MCRVHNIYSYNVISLPPGHNSLRENQGFQVNSQDFWLCLLTSSTPSSTHALPPRGLAPALLCQRVGRAVVGSETLRGVPLRGWIHKSGQPSAVLQPISQALSAAPPFSAGGAMAASVAVRTPLVLLRLLPQPRPGGDLSSVSPPPPPHSPTR